MKINEIKPHPLNKDLYDLRDIDGLMASITDLGLLEPIIVSHKGYIISGHRRYEACKRLGLKEIETRVIDVNEEDEELLLVEYNRQRIKTASTLLKEYKVLEKYGKKRDKVGIVVDGIKKYSRALIADKIGQSSSQMARLLFIDKHRPDIIKAIDKDELSIRAGYYWVKRDLEEKNSRIDKPKVKQTNINGWRVYIKSSADMSELKDGEIQTIFTSPPYWDKRTYTEGGGLGNEKTPQSYINNLVEHLGECWRVLNNEGSFFLNLGDTYHNGDLQNIPHRVLFELKDRYGWIQRNTIIWKKTNPMPSSSKVNLTPTYEYIYHLVKSKDYYYNPTLTKSKEDTKPAIILNKSKDGDYSGKSVSPYIPNELGKNMGDYWSEDVVETAVANQPIDLPNNKIHIARFSEKIVLLPLLQTSKEGDLVLDPFMGSGTTGRVCVKVNRRFVGYDVNNYLE